LVFDLTAHFQVFSTDLVIQDWIMLENSEESHPKDGLYFQSKASPNRSTFNHLGFNSPPLAASCHSGESRNPEIYTGCRIRSGMTSDTPLLCGGVVHRGFLYLKLI
jgi:hypothetical protein